MSLLRLGPAWAAGVIAGLITMPVIPVARAAQPDAALVVAVWYRGSPRGVPNADEMAELRAMGFTTMVWPNSTADLLNDVRRVAGQVGLSVVTRRSMGTLTPAAAAAGGSVVDLRVDRTDARDVPGLTWRAVAHGTKQVAFDAGEVPGAIWRLPSGELAPWVAPARALARQFTFNADLLRTLGRARVIPPIESAARDVEVALFEAPRSWVIIATNVARDRVRGTAVLPAGVPAAPWADLFDGEVMAMLDAPGGARWSFDLPRGAARIYAIDKN